MTPEPSGPRRPGEAGGGPASVDVERYLSDGDSEMRRLAAAHWYADGLDVDGSAMPWVLGYDDVRAVLRDRRLCPRSFTDDMRRGGVSDRTAEQLTPLFRRTGEEHRRHRALLAAAFTPRRVERLRPAARAVADRLVAAIPPGEAVDFVASVAAPLPAEVFALLFGLPPADGPRLARWGATIAQAFIPGLTPDQVGAVERAAAELGAYCAGVIEQRQAEPADDLTTHLLEVEVAGERLDHDEVVATMSAFIFAGSETTRRQLTALLMMVAEVPGLWARLATDASLVPGAVEEALRHRPIVSALTRVADEAFDHDGLDLPVGGRLMVSVTTANHDPVHFDDPEATDVTRPDAAEHLTFGWGPHFCLGAGLARMEMAEALGALLERFGPPQVTGVTASSGLTAPDELGVVFVPRRR
jgi:cytochrome P450